MKLPSVDKGHPIEPKIPVKLTGVPETLLIPLYVCASETLKPDGLFKDECAVATLQQLDVDLRRLKMQDHDADVVGRVR